MATKQNIDKTGYLQTKEGELMGQAHVNDPDINGNIDGNGGFRYRAHLASVCHGPECPYCKKQSGQTTRGERLRPFNHQFTPALG